MKNRIACMVKRAVARPWWTALVVVCFAGISSAGPVTAWHKEPDRFGHAKWESLGTKSGIQLARKQLPASQMFAVRGEVVIDAPMAKVASVIYDETRWTQWSKNTTQATMLSNGPGTMKTVYQAVKMPFILSNRDVVYTFGYEYVNDQLLIIGRTLPYHKPPRSVGVRMHLLEGRWFLKPVKGNQTHLVVEILMDPKGSLPVWFVNLVQKDYPVGLLTSLEKQAKRADVKPLKLPSAAMSDQQRSKTSPSRVR